MTWLPIDSKYGDRDGDALVGFQSEATDRMFEFLAIADSVVDPELLNLCRTRAAQALDCRPVLKRCDPGLLADLENWESAPRFSAKERALLEYYEQFMIAPLYVTPEQRETLRSELGYDPSTLAYALYINEAYLRFLTFFGVENEPSASRDAVLSDDAGPVSDYLSDAATSTQETDPRVVEALLAFGAAICRETAIDDTTDEVVRLRSANYQGCVFCQSVRRKVDRPASIDDLMPEALAGAASTVLSERQKVALEALDHLIIKPSAMDDAARSRILEHFQPNEIVELMLKEVWWMSNKPMISLGTDFGAVDENHLTEFEYDGSGNFTLLATHSEA